VCYTARARINACDALFDKRTRLREVSGALEQARAEQLALGAARAADEALLARIEAAGEGAMFGEGAGDVRARLGAHAARARALAAEVDLLGLRERSSIVTLEEAAVLQPSVDNNTQVPSPPRASDDSLCADSARGASDEAPRGLRT
jgi:hypothetical protein